MGAMIKILKEVEEVRKNPEIATSDSRDMPFEDPLIFREYIPRVEPIPVLDSGEEAQEAFIPLCRDINGELLPAENAKVVQLKAEKSKPGKADSNGRAMWFWGIGDVFCSLDYLKPDWVLAEVSVNVERYRLYSQPPIHQRHGHSVWKNRSARQTGPAEAQYRGKREDCGMLHRNRPIGLHRCQ